MNTTRPPRSADRPPVEERDWLAQERALANPAGDRRDALLARALRTMPVSQPPPDFAAAVARMAAAGATMVPREESPLERMLLNVLLGVMTLAAAVMVAMYGGQWWALAGEALGPGAAQWTLVAGACLLLSWLPDATRRLYEATRGPETA